MSHEFKKFINNKINITSKKYSLILGLKPSEGARSPKIWNKFYNKLKIDCKMYPADLSNKNLKNLVICIKKDSSFVGAAVTMPYKETITKHIDILDKFAKKIGSINTIVREDNKLKGYNTDYLACKNLINKFKNKKKILVLGLGGAGKAVLVATIEIFRNKEIIVFNRDIKKVKKFLKSFNEKKIKILKNYDALAKLKKIDLVINSTSVGFDLWQKNKKGFFNLKFFSPLSNLNKIAEVKTKNEKNFINVNQKLLISNSNQTELFFKTNQKASIIDIIYQPLKTKLIRISKAKKIKTENGLKINKLQAIKAFILANKISNSKIRNKILSI